MVLLANNDQFSRWAAFAAIALAVCVIVWNVGRTASLFVSGAASGAVTDTSNQAAAGTPTPTTLGHLAGLNLFGEGATTALTSTQQAPQETRLNLRLLGSLALESPDDLEARAFIVDGSGEQGVFAPGDDLPGGARLAEVHRDKVVLSYKGKRETLTLPRPEGSDAVTQPRGRMAGRQTATGRLAAIRGSGNANSITGSLQQVRAQYKLDPGRLAKDVQVMPYMEQGQLMGVRLRPGKNAALLERLGLRTSDVILGVNGVALNDPANAPRVLEQLNSASSFSVDVRRGGKRTTLNIDLNG